MCGAECESVVHVLWECSSYSACRDNFQEALKLLLGARYVEFETLSAVLYVLGSENWEDFDALLHLVKEFIVAVWEVLIPRSTSAPVLGRRSGSCCWSWGYGW